MSSLFRPEALAHHAGSDVRGDVLRCDPRWVRVATPLVVGAVAVGALLSCILAVDEYASGPAVVRVDGRRLVTATAAGPIEEVHVRPGQRVEAGAVLVRLASTEESNELARAEGDLELQLVRALVDPTDAAVRAAVSSLRSRRDAAKNAVEARTLRAPVAGVVSDVRARPGQHVAPGDVVCAVVPREADPTGAAASDGATVSLVAMLPADYRPMLAPGLPLRFELDGFRFEYEDVVVEEVSAEAVGTHEVQRFLGGEHEGAVQLDPGGKVFVTARLPAATFISEGRPFAYFDGLTGNAEVRVRREPLVITLVPALRKVWP